MVGERVTSLSAVRTDLENTITRAYAERAPRSVVTELSMALQLVEAVLAAGMQDTAAALHAATGAMDKFARWRAGRVPA
jgi:hypothetical protein